MSDIELIKKENGLKIIACSMPSMRSVSTVIGIAAGSVYEKKEQRGISHFIEHMLFKGTQKRKNTLEISQCIEQLGGEINASTSEEYTFLYSKVLNKNFASAFEVMVDILNHSFFREEDIMQETRAVLQDILDRYECGIYVIAVQLQDADPPQEVDAAFKDVASAKEDREKMINEAQGYRNDVIPRTRGQEARAAVQWSLPGGHKGSRRVRCVHPARAALDVSGLGGRDHQLRKRDP